MPIQLQTADPDFIAASTNPSSVQAPTNDPDFIPASPLPNATTQASKPDPDFIPAKDEGESWADTIWNGIKNMGYNTVVRPFTQAPQLAKDVYTQNWGSVQTDTRKNLEATFLPFAKPEDVEQHVEVSPDEGITEGKGTWEALTANRGIERALLSLAVEQVGVGAPIESKNTGQKHDIRLVLMIFNSQQMADFYSGMCKKEP